MTQRSALSDEEALLHTLEPWRQKLAAHTVYRSIGALEDLRLFLQSHVFAVWDFMSLLKALQRELTCVTVPWLPGADRASRRLINQIVLGEESDEYQGGSLSHFELYIQAMRSCGADTGPILSLVEALRGGSDLDTALAVAPAEAAAFVRATFSVLATGSPHRIAAAFTFGREDLIPEMFGAFVRRLDTQMPGQIAPFRYYLERHIEMDGEEHGPLALGMMRNLCRTSQQWAEAQESASAALAARVALWDGIEARVLAPRLEARETGSSSNR